MPKFFSVPVKVEDDRFVCPICKSDEGISVRVECIEWCQYEIANGIFTIQDTMDNDYEETYLECDKCEQYFEIPEEMW